MSITREQVADLREGDVVELRHPDADWTITGPLVPLFNGLGVAGWAVTETHPDSINAQLDVRIISRAPRPLYVNSDRTEAKHGDTVVDCDGNAWQRRGARWFMAHANGSGVEDISDCAPLTLLWNAETGQVVP